MQNDSSTTEEFPEDSISTSQNAFLLLFIIFSPLFLYVKTIAFNIDRILYNNVLNITCEE